MEETLEPSNEAPSSPDKSTTVTDCAFLAAKWRLARTYNPRREGLAFKEDLELVGETDLDDFLAVFLGLEEKDPDPEDDLSLAILKNALEL